MKKISIIIVSLILIFTTATGVSAYGEFYDLDSSHWAYNTVTDLVRYGKITGYMDNGRNYFRPENHVSRAEFVTMVYNIFGLEGYNRIDSTRKDANFFKDIQEDAWYFKYVHKAYLLGYVAGDENRLFYPERTLSREEAAVILNNILKVKLDISKVLKFNDHRDISYWAENAIYQLELACVISGYKGNYFNPKGDITRAESAVLVEKAYEYGRSK